VAKVVTRIFESKGEAVRMLSAIAAKEIDATGELNFFFFFYVAVHSLTVILSSHMDSLRSSRSERALPR
jgi:hypothetical protein